MTPIKKKAAKKAAKKAVTVREKMIYQSLGRAIAICRLYHGMSQEVLSAKIGMTRANLANLESGRMRISVHRVMDIGIALGVKWTSLLPATTGKQITWLSLPKHKQYITVKFTRPAMSYKRKARVR